MLACCGVSTLPRGALDLLDDAQTRTIAVGLSVCLITIDSKYGAKSRHIMPARGGLLPAVRNNLCTSIYQISAKRKEYDRAPLKYPQARIYKLSLSIFHIGAYRNTFGID